MEPSRQELTAIDRGYIREKVEEGYADAGAEGFHPLDMAAINAELKNRLWAKSERKTDVAF